MIVLAENLFKPILGPVQIVKQHVEIPIREHDVKIEIVSGMIEPPRVISIKLVSKIILGAAISRKRQKSLFEPIVQHFLNCVTNSPSLDAVDAYLR